MARSPFRKPDIDFIPDAGGYTPPEPVPDGDEGQLLTVGPVLDALEDLQNEISDAVMRIERSLSDFAITDKDGTLAAIAQRVLGTDTAPLSISYDTYVALKAYDSEQTVGEVFEEKAYSIWGNASIALVDALTAVSTEASRASSFLKSGVSDPGTIDLLADWAGSARMFALDCIEIGTADATKDAADEAQVYANQAVEVQKSAIIGSATLKSDIRREISRIRTLYSSSDVYDSHFDRDPRVDIVSGGIVPVLVERHAELASKVRAEQADGLSYRVEAFNEFRDKIIGTVAQLRATQFVNKELVNVGGISESNIDTVVCTKPDVSFDVDVKKTIRKERNIADDDSLSLEIVRSAVLADVANIIPEAPDLTSIDAVSVGGKSYSDIIDDVDIQIQEYASPTDHTHTNVDADTLDGYHASDFVLDSSSTFHMVNMNAYDMSADYTEPSAVSGWRVPVVSWTGLTTVYATIPNVQEGDIVEVFVRAFINGIIDGSSTHISASLFDGETATPFKRYSTVQIPIETIHPSERTSIAHGFWKVGASPSADVRLKFEVYSGLSDAYIFRSSFNQLGVEVYSQMAFKHYRP